MSDFSIDDLDSSPEEGAGRLGDIYESCSQCNIYEKFTGKARLRLPEAKPHLLLYTVFLGIPASRATFPLRNRPRFPQIISYFPKNKSANKQDHASIHGDSLPLLTRRIVVSTAQDAQEFSVQVHNMKRIFIFIRGNHEIAINNIEEFLDFCIWY